MRDIELRVGDIVTWRSGKNRTTRVLIEDIDYERSSPNAWHLTGPRVTVGGVAHLKDLEGPMGNYRVRPSNIVSVSEGVLREWDQETDLYVDWSPGDEAYAVMYGDGYVALVEGFEEAMDIVRSYA